MRHPPSSSPQARPPEGTRTEGVSRRGFLTGGFLSRLRGESPARHEPELSATPSALPEPEPVPEVTPTLLTPKVGWRGQRRAVLRPPGAIEERAFLSLCTRCGECVSACPTGAIVSASSAHHAAEGFPLLDPAVGGCRMCPDTPCITSCQTGALSRLIPLRMGSAHIMPDRCVRSAGEACEACMVSCPVPGALHLRDGKPVVDEALCTGCGSCRNVCPAPMNAVVIVPTRHRAKAENQS